MSEIKEQIVERLREACRDYSGEMIVRGSTPRYEVHCDLLYDAADRIEALERERTNLIETKRTLEEALRPFATSPDDWTVDTVNAARLALNATPQDGKGGEEW